MALDLKTYTYEEAVNALAFRASIETGQTVAALTEYYSQFTPDEVATLMLDNAGADVYSSYAQNGTIKLWYGKPTVTNTVATGGSINSNMTTTLQGSMQPVIETTVDATTQEVTLAQKAATIGGKAVNFFTGSVVPAVAAASVGISLGKTVDSALYNEFPDFFDAHDMSTLDPSTWSSITSGDDSLGAKLFNFIFGIDADGNTQAYLDEEAYAYLAQWMASKQFFDVIETIISGDTSGISWDMSFPIKLTDIAYPYYSESYKYNTLGVWDRNDRVWVSAPMMLVTEPDNPRFGVVALVPNDGHTYAINYCTGIHSIGSSTAGGGHSANNATLLTSSGNHKYALMNSVPNALVTYETQTVAPFLNYVSGTNPTSPSYQPNSGRGLADLLETGVYDYSGVVPGIGNQSGATTPVNYDQWTTPQNTLQSLQNQYPDLWNQAVPITTLQPDGTTTTTNYIPIPMPSATSATDTQPVNGDQTQSTTDTKTSSMDAIKTLVSELLATPVDNAPDTGSGSSPTPVPIGATASSLWAIYHPTEAQVDSFGAWLWSPSLINQIQALMFSPIESVISLHKIYATPIDVGSTTIQVGYLDSEVPSNYVEEQYVYVDCGSVSVAEYFGNVFDYSPNTSINLYLPFIGIVPLDVDSVMRGNISIEYGVDILTGDCLAMIEVQRDGCTSIQYQYSGNCAVHYPLTAGNYMAMLTNSLTGAASGFAGGGVIGAVAGGALGAMRTGADVKRSGNFSGNSGAMGGKIPYLIIERPQTKVAGYFEHYQGYPTNAYVTVGECSGYVKASTLHTDGVSATDREIDMIRKALMSGVIV